MMTTSLFAIANVKQLRTYVVLEFYCLFRTSWCVGVLNSAFFLNSFHNRVECGTIFWRTFGISGGGLNTRNPPWVRHWCQAPFSLQTSQQNRENFTETAQAIRQYPVSRYNQLTVTQRTVTATLQAQCTMHLKYKGRNGIQLPSPWSINTLLAAELLWRRSGTCSVSTATATDTYCTYYSKRDSLQYTARYRIPYNSTTMCRYMFRQLLAILRRTITGHCGRNRNLYTASYI